VIPTSTVEEHEPGPGCAPKPSTLALLRRSVAEDLRWAWRYLILGRFAASPFTPRAVRFLLYRSMRLGIRSANVWPRCTIVGRHLSIGPGTFVNQQCFFEAIAPIQIGRACQIGMSVMIVTSHHQLTGGGALGNVTCRPVTIGDRVWIGARALILPGVSIADRVVVAAGAVVSSDLVEPGVYAGVPARKIRDL